jgi:release factor glutamine methyltransferase
MPCSRPRVARLTLPPDPLLADVLTNARQRLDAAGIEDAALEAELLLRYVLALVESTKKESPYAALPGSAHPEALEGPMLSVQPPLTPEPPVPVSRALLYARLNDPLDASAAEHFVALIDRRLAHEPSAYITGHREFYGLDFLVTPAVLIPRPETETLVEVAIEFIKTDADAPSPKSEREWRAEVLDVGTGSGAIAISLACTLPGAAIIATDASDAALNLARRNARRHGVLERIAFRSGDLLEPLDAPVNLIVANLPYVKTIDWSALPPEIRDHEPRLALDGGPDGLDVIRRFLDQAPHYLQPGGAIALEFGPGQSEVLLALARAAFPGSLVNIRNDLAGRPRVLTIRLV